MKFQGSKVDLTISVDRFNLIDILTDNQGRHVATFEQAMKGYNAELVRLAKENLERAEKGEAPKGLNESKPRNYAPQYERALGMLRLSKDELVGLSAYDYARFVEDDWDWKKHFLSNSRAYGAEGE